MREAYRIEKIYSVYISRCDAMLNIRISAQTRPEQRLQSSIVYVWRMVRIAHYRHRAVVVVVCGQHSPNTPH